MNPTELRNHNFQTIRDTLNDRCVRVLCQLAVHGPCTTRQLAERAHMDILSVRPRVTDLCHMGLAQMTGSESGEGVYRATTETEWEAFRSGVVERLTSGQMQLC